MPELEYFIVIMFFCALWAICFLLGSQSWQVIGAFVPFSVAAYLYYGGKSNWDLLIFTPALALLIIDIHIVLSSPKFKGVVRYVNYLLIVPLLATYFYFSDGFTKSDSWIGTAFTHLAMCALIVYAGKFWFSDVLLLFINRLWIKDKQLFETRINHVYIKGTGKSRSFYASVYQLGNVEISGFFYQYVRWKKINAQEKVQLVVKRGWLGTEFIAGFPKIIERSL